MKAAGIHQSMLVRQADDRSRRVESIKFRWRMSYRHGGGEVKNETGDVAEFTLA